MLLRKHTTYHFVQFQRPRRCSKQPPERGDDKPSQSHKIRLSSNSQHVTQHCQQYCGNCKDMTVRNCRVVLKLCSPEDQMLLVSRNAFLVLTFRPPGSLPTGSAAPTFLNYSGRSTSVLGVRGGFGVQKLSGLPSLSMQDGGRK